ncbi:hypothetical protein WN093_01990 [Gammaproteobacteria bacterium AS21]
MSDTCITGKEQIAQLQLGESPIKDAPLIALLNGESCIPQHYLRYQHDRTSVEKIILDIEYSADYPIFVGENQQGIYIQLGIIGGDNYASSKKTATKKLVYGRKWRVEPTLPTSEIIQTVFLAIKTAKEHEVRELFQLTDQGSLTTPFNNHHDLPVLARVQNIFACCPSEMASTLNEDQLQQALDNIRYDNASFELIHCEKRHQQQWLLDIKLLASANTQLMELKETQITLTILLTSPTKNILYQQLMSELITLANTHIEQYFCYKGFNRFSKEHDIMLIAELSCQLRNKGYLENKDEFVDQFVASNYDTDKTRVPSLYQGPLSDKIKELLQSYPHLEGFLPQALKSPSQ